MLVKRSYYLAIFTGKINRLFELRICARLGMSTDDDVARSPATRESPHVENEGVQGILRRFAQGRAVTRDELHIAPHGDAYICEPTAPGRSTIARNDPSISQTRANNI